MCNKVYNSFSFGHFLVDLIEHELYLGCILFVKPFSIFGWIKMDHSYVFFLYD
jgi:hypothetical protein